MTIVLVDDHTLFREALRILLKAADPSLDVVGEAGDAREAAALVERLKPTLVLMDVILAGTNGIAAARELRRVGFGGHILMLTSVREPAFVADAFAAGAQGYALKDQTIEEIVGAIRRVVQGGQYLTPRLEQAMGGAVGADGPGAMESLSVREREVFGLVTGGYTNNRIAAELFISVKTVATHRSRINRKLHVHSTAELIRLAALHGMVSA